MEGGAVWVALFFFWSKQFKCSVVIATILFPMLEKAFISMAGKRNAIMVWPQLIHLNRLSPAVYCAGHCPAGLVLLSWYGEVLDSNASKEGGRRSGWGPQMCVGTSDSAGCFHREEKALTSSPSFELILPVLYRVLMVSIYGSLSKIAMNPS